MTPTTAPPTVPPGGPVRLGQPVLAASGDPERAPRQSSMEWTATFVGALAILAGSSALSATIDGRGWVLPLVEVVVVITLIGVGGRMIRMPAVITVLLQFGAMAVALTSLFTSSGIAGVLPNKEAVAEAGQLLSGAWQQILSTVPPAPSTPELSFLIALSVGLAALIVDFLISEAKAPALVALPLLCLYSVPASIATGLLPWYTFAAPAILYALLLAVAGHSGRRTGLRAGMGMAVNGTVIAALAIVVSLLLASTVTIVGTTGRLPRTSASSGQIGLSPFTSLRGNLLRSNPISLLSVHGLAGPDYLRTVALTTWKTGQGWSLGDLADGSTNNSGALPGYTVVPGDTEVSVTSLAFRDRFLPMYQHTVSVRGLTTDWSYDSALGAVHRADPGNPGTYLLQVHTSKPTADELEQDTVTPGGTLTATDSLPAQVVTIAQQVTKSATTAFGKATALQKWFVDSANGFKYSLTVPPGKSGDPLVDFLQNRQGYCEQYASAMAVMLRAIGIPSRVAIGFTQGALQPDGGYLINSHDAHAWVEVQFDTAGWVRFDPTPLVDGQGGQQGFEGATSASVPTPTTAATGTQPSATGQLPDGERTDRSTAVLTTQSSVAAPEAAAGGGWLRLSGWVAVVIVVLGLVLLAPTVLRRRRRHRRLAVAASGGPGAAAAAWAEIEDLATDHAVPVQPAESVRVAANRLARRAHLGDRQRELLRRAVVAAEQGWYGVDGSESAGAGSTGAGSTGAGSTGAGSTGAGSTGAGSTGAGLSSAGSTAARDRGRTTASGIRAPSSTATLTRRDGIEPADLVAAVDAMAAGLARNEPIGWIDRWIPRSLRESGR